jgi:hypothetical protein
VPRPLLRPLLLLLLLLLLHPYLQLSPGLPQPQQVVAERRGERNGEVSDERHQGEEEMVEESHGREAESQHVTALVRPHENGGLQHAWMSLCPVPAAAAG